jgi:hypothetical protein
VARDTLTNTKSELHALFCADTASGRPHADLAAVEVKKVWKGEPRQVDGVLEMSVATAAVTPEDWVFAVRLYAKADDGTIDAQDRIDAALPAVDDRLMTNAGFGPFNWEIEWREDLVVWVATATVNAGRNDYF